jgi:hypothetical protein
MRRWTSTFGKSLSRAGVAGVLVSAVLALLAAGTGQVLAADFYVGGDGASDRNPGTASQPFATIQKAAGVAAAGDFVNIRPGIYRETVVPANSGAPGQPITFQPDGDAEVTVSGADLVDGGWTVYSGQIYQTAIALPLTGYGEQITGNADAIGQSGVCRRQDDD